MKDTHTNVTNKLVPLKQNQRHRISKMPMNSSIALISLVICIWYQMTSFNDKMVGLFLACSFGITELTWTGLTIEDGDGVYFSPFSPKKRQPHTVSY